MNARDRIEVGSEVVEFYRDFVKLVEWQLSSIQAQVDETVHALMKSIDEVNTMAESVSAKAEKSLTTSFTSPDMETEGIIKEIQDEVSKVFEEAISDLNSGSSSQGESDYKVKLKNINSKFGKDMQNMNELDDVLQNCLLSMMGALSMEDVIAQKVDHAEVAISAVHRELYQVIKELSKNDDKRLDITPYKKVALKETFSSFTTEEEKDLFRRVFGEDSL